MNNVLRELEENSFLYDAPNRQLITEAETKQFCPRCGFTMIKSFFKWYCTNSLCELSHDIYGLTDEELSAYKGENGVEELYNNLLNELNHEVVK